MQPLFEIFLRGLAITISVCAIAFGSARAADNLYCEGPFGPIRTPLLHPPVAEVVSRGPLRSFLLCTDIPSGSTVTSLRCVTEVITPHESRFPTYQCPLNLTCNSSADGTGGSVGGFNANARDRKPSKVNGKDTICFEFVPDNIGYDQVPRVQLKLQ